MNLQRATNVRSNTTNVRSVTNVRSNTTNVRSVTNVRSNTTNVRSATTTKTNYAISFDNKEFNDIFRLFELLLVIPTSNNTKIITILQPFYKNNNYPKTISTLFKHISKYIDINKTNDNVIIYLELLKIINKYIKKYKGKEQDITFKLDYKILVDIVNCFEKKYEKIKYETDRLLKEVIFAEDLPTAKGILIYGFYEYKILEIILKLSGTDMDIDNDLMIIEKLYNKTILNVKKYNSQSISLSETSKSNEMLTEKEEILKQQILKDIKKTVINTEDYILQEEWSTMQFNKLKYFIKLERKDIYVYTSETKRYYGFLAKELYKQWSICIKDKIPFTHPLTRKSFEDNEKNIILEKLREFYPSIKEPSLSKKIKFFSVLYFSNPIIYNNVKVYKFDIIFHFNDEEYQLPFNRRLFSFYIPTKYDFLPEQQMQPHTIISKLSVSIEKNKFFGKKFPFQLPEICKKYGFISRNKQIKALSIEENYINFCDSILSIP